MFETSRDSGGDDYGFFASSESFGDLHSSPFAALVVSGSDTSNGGVGRSAGERSASAPDSQGAETPAWEITEGSAGASCPHCRRRVVLAAVRHTPGHVFMKSFPSASPAGRHSRSADSSGSFASSRSGDGSSQLFESSWSVSDGLPGSPDGGGRSVPVAAVVGGFRVVAGRFGVQWAEFEIAVSSGATVSRVWRTLDDVAKFVGVIGLQRRATCMPKSHLLWEVVNRQKRWLNACDTMFLITQRGSLEILFEALVHELDSSTQLLNFVDDETWHDDAAERAAAACPCTALTAYARETSRP